MEWIKWPPWVAPICKGDNRGPGKGSPVVAGGRPRPRELLGRGAKAWSRIPVSESVTAQRPTLSGKSGGR